MTTTATTTSKTFLDARGRVSVITGGTRGIGEASARELAALGSAIALLDLDGELAARVAAGIASEFGVEARGYALDVRDSVAAKRVIDAVAGDFGGLDHLVNNAGVQHVSPIGDFTDDQWAFVRAIDLDGVYYATRAAWPHLIARKRGRIVNLASVQGLLASPYKAAYVAAKHGVVGLSRATAVEGAAFGITCNAVCPGAVMTDIVRNQAKQLVASYGGGMSEEEALERAFLTEMPTKRFIEPREVGQLVAYLCSEAARSITGAPVSIDGGWAAS